jgi:uncharacterized protein YkwD
MKNFKVHIGAFLLLCSLAAGTGTGDTADAMTRAHNSVRRTVGVPELRWSNQLSADAQRWADELIARNAFEPQRGLRWGQNLFEIVNGAANPWQVVQGWASESANYDPRTNTCSARCGHYTQLVWRDTKYVGCAAARRGNREVWVCDYLPPGNILGERPY